LAQVSLRKSPVRISQTEGFCIFYYTGLFDKKQEGDSQFSRKEKRAEIPPGFGPFSPQTAENTGKILDRQF
jgi:hypothetical protein